MEYPDLNTAIDIKPMGESPTNVAPPVTEPPPTPTPSAEAPVPQPPPTGEPTPQPPAPPATPPGTPTAEAPTSEAPATPPAANEPAPEPEPSFNEREQAEIFNEHLTFNTGGKIKSLDELDKILEENASLKGKPAEPQFKNEAAKRIYEFAKRVDANEISDEDGLNAAQRQLRVLGLPLSKMSDRDKLFEAFLLDEQNSDLTREKALEIFNEEYTNLYQSADENILTKRKLEVAVRNAEGVLKKMQSEAMSPQSKQTPSEDAAAKEEIEKNTRIAYENIDRVMNGFEGLAISTDENGEFNFKLDPIKDAAKLTRISEVMKNPGQFIQDVINDLYDEGSNKFDYEGFQAFVTSMLYADEISMAMLKHGMNLGKEAYLKELKNPPAPAGSGGGPPVDNRSVDDKAWDKLGQLLNVPN